MLAAFATLALSLPADPHTCTVEFLVLRVPAGSGIVPQTYRPISTQEGLAQQKYPDTSYQMLPRYSSEKSSRVLPGDSAPHGISGDSLQDADGLPGYDAGTVPLWLKTAELNGPKLNVGLTPVTQTLTRPEWAVRTLKGEEWPRQFLRGPVYHYTPRVLVSEATFTASAVPTSGGRFEVCVRYTETELPPAKEEPPPLTPDLAAFYADAPAPQSPVASFGSPGVVNGAELARLRPGESCVFSAGRRVVRGSQIPLDTRLEQMTRRGTTEEDVVVVVTVR